MLTCLFSILVNIVIKNFCHQIFIWNYWHFNFLFDLLMPWRCQYKIRHFWVSGPEMRFPQILSSISFIANWASKPTQFRVVFWEVNDNIWAIWRRVSADGTEVFFHRLRPDIFIAEHCFSFPRLKVKLKPSLYHISTF